MLSSTITDRDVAVGVRAVVIATRILLGKLSDPDFVPLDQDDSPIVLEQAVAPEEEQSARGDRLRGFARRGGQLARQGVVSGIGRWAGERPGSVGWTDLDRDRRGDWWMSTVGRVTALVAALPGLAGAVGERVPVKDLVSAAGQALLLCAIAHEYDVRDTDDYVVLVASVILDRDLTAVVGQSAIQPAEQEAEHLTGEIRTASSSTMARHLATGTSLVRIGRRLHSLQQELDNRPRGHVGQRLAGSLPVVGLVGQYRGERRGLRIVSDRGRQWCAERVEQQVRDAVPVPPREPRAIPPPTARPNPTYDEMRSAMALVEDVTRRLYPTAVVDGENYARSPSWRFGIESPGGIALVWADVRDVEPGGSWHMQFTAGIAHMVSDIGGALQWVNEQNRVTTMGRYYLSVAHHGQCGAILWEGSLWSRIVTDRGPSAGPDGVVDWIAQLVHMCVETPTDHRAVLQDLGGVSYPTGAQGMSLLTATA